MNGKIEYKIHEQIRMDLRKKVGCHVANQVWDDIVTQVFDVVYSIRDDFRMKTVNYIIRNLKENSCSISRNL